MHRHEVLSEYRLRLKAVSERVARATALRDRLSSELATRKSEVETLSRKLDVHSKVSELFRALLDRLVMEHVRSIEGVVTEGLRMIFSDQDLSFEAAVSQRFGKVAIDFYLSQKGHRVAVRAHPLEAFGGGPASVASLILKVLAMRRLAKWPLLVMDETLAAVSDEYIDQTGLFLRELARKTQMSLLLVTHKPSFLEHADVAYRAGSETNRDGSRHLTLEREHHAIRS